MTYLFIHVDDLLFSFIQNNFYTITMLYDY